MRAQTAVFLSALAISISAVSPAAADPAELPEGAPIDGGRLSGIDDPTRRQRWLARLRSPHLDRVVPEVVAADIRRLWQTRQFADVSCAVVDGQLVFAVVERRRAPAPAAESEAPPVAAIHLAGNRAIDDGELRGRLESTGEPLDRETLWRDELRLRAIYRERGFLEASVSRAEVGRDAAGRAHARFTIVEGPRYRLGVIDPRAAESLEPGAVYSHRQIAAAAAAITGRLADRGHAFASVEPALAVDRAAGTVAVRFAVEPGEVARVAAVIIRGNRKTRDRVIRREIEIAPGDPYNASAVERSRRRIAALGYFESVQVSTEPGTSEREAIVTFAVSERPTGQFQIGAGFSSTEHVVATAGVEQANLFGTGQRLSLGAQLSTVRQLFSLRWNDPHLADTDWAGGVELYNNRELYNRVAREAIGGAVTFGRSLGDRWSAAVTYRLEDVATAPGGALWTARASDPTAVGPDVFGGGLTSSLQTTLAYDSRDDRLAPRSGTHAGGSVEIASPVIGSEVDLARTGAWVRHHRPVAGAVGLTAGAEVGLVSTRDPAGVPLAHRYHLGGAGSVRGYERASLGPRVRLGGDPDGELGELVLGGNLTATATLELTAPVIDSIGLGAVVFADAGQVFNLDRRYCDAAGCPGSAAALLRGLRASVGFGLRWRSPLGLLRFEWGFPLFRRPDEPWVRFHFGIGPVI